MRTMKKLAITAVVALLALAVVQPAHAACGTPFLVTQTGSVTGPSGSVYVYDTQPGFSPAGRGVFWSLGNGDPAPGPGNDNGTFGGQNWISGIRSGIFPGGWYNYQQTLFTSWAANATIDGCIGLDGPNACTCVLITDENTLTADGVMSLGSALRDGAGNYTIAGNLVMDSVPTPVITNSVRNGVGVDLQVMVPMPAANTTNLHPMCNCLAGATFDVYAIEQPRLTAVAPSARDISGWTQISSSSTPLGATSALGVVSSPCTGAQDANGDTDLWLAAVINFDGASAGGFPNTYVSTNSTKVECGVNLAEPEPVKIQHPGQRRGQKRDRIR